LETGLELPLNPVIDAPPAPIIIELIDEDTVKIDEDAITPPPPPPPAPPPPPPPATKSTSILYAPLAATEESAVTLPLASMLITGI
jgi:hypothetical protein